MKPPVKLDELMDQWEKDAPWDPLKPDYELSQVPILHARYLNIRSHHNVLKQGLVKDLKKLKHIKYQYYDGKLNNPVDLAKHNLQPIDEKIPKTSIPRFVDADEELSGLELRVSIQEEIVYYCDSVLKELNARTYQIRGKIEYYKFEKGSG